MAVIKIAQLGCAKEPLRAPFSFKGGSLSELWHPVVRLTLSNGISGMGVGVQSVLWSDPITFCQNTETAGNDKMLAITKRALALLQGMEFTTPPHMLTLLTDPLLAYAKETLGRAQVPLTFILNALVAVDFALWQLWNAEHGDNTFDTLTRTFCPQLTAQESVLGNIPLLTYHTSESEIRELLENGTFLLKIKIGADPDTNGDTEAMLAWDIARLAQIHCIADTYQTPHTTCKKPVYYLDANGRYPDKNMLLRFLDAADKIGALERILLLEEPFAADNIVPVHNLPVCIVGDESAHSADDVERLVVQYGYGAIALKPIAKTLSVTLDMVSAATKNGAACFCADLTVPPVMLDWNMNLAARLPRLPGLGMGVVESNGPQNYPNWVRLNNLCAVPQAPWRIQQNGLYPLGKDFYDAGGVFLPLPAYIDYL